MEAQESNFSIEKWENLGVLEGLTDEQKVKTVVAFNIALNYLIKNEDKYETFFTIPFPVIHRILKTRDLSEEEVIEIIDDCIPSCKKFIETSDFTSFYSTVDVEAEFISYYAEQKIEELNTRATEIGLKQLREQKEATISRWEKLGL
jgi:TusA-related sulfurtransferase